MNDSNTVSVILHPCDVTREAEIITRSRDVAVDGGHVTESRLRAMMQDARRLVGVSHVNICPVVAACFDTVTAEPAWLVYNSSTSSVYLKTFLDHSRNQTNVRSCRVFCPHAWKPLTVSVFLSVCATGLAGAYCKDHLPSYVLCPTVCLTSVNTTCCKKALSDCNETCGVFGTVLNVPIRCNKKRYFGIFINFLSLVFANESIMENYSWGSFVHPFMVNILARKFSISDRNCRKRGLALGYPTTRTHMALSYSNSRKVASPAIYRHRSDKLAVTSSATGREFICLFELKLNCIFFLRSIMSFWIFCICMLYFNYL